MRDKISTFCGTSDEIEFAVLFGSHSRGEALQHSDIDLGIYLEIPSSLERLTLIQQFVRILETEAVDLILLNRVDPLLGYQIARDAKLLYVRDSCAFETWRLSALRAYFDAGPLFRDERAYVKQFLRQEVFMLDTQLVERKLRQMVEYLQDLQRFEPLSLDEYESQRDTQYIVERLLQLVIEVATDVNNHLIRASQQPPATNYYESFMLAGRYGWIDTSLARELAPSTGLRNALIHEYENIDANLVHQSIAQALTLFPQYIEQVQAHLESEMPV